MQALSKSRKLARVLKPQILLNTDQRFLYSTSEIINPPLTSLQWKQTNSLLSHRFHFSGMSGRVHSKSWGLSFSTEAGVGVLGGNSTEAVKELYDKMLESVNVKRSMPPNAWMWSLIENCQTHEDIRLLFDILQNLRRFRLSNLRIHENFNDSLCRETTKACARVGAVDFGKKALWKHNVYGLTPTIGSANHLLSYSHVQKDAKLMMEIMELLKKNELPLQPGTADIVFRICYDTDNWELISKYSKRFAKAGVKFRKTSFEIWMEFAAKRGDTESLWKIEKLRSESIKQHTVGSTISCAKGFLLEHRPEDAAAIIQVTNQQTLPDAKKSNIMVELQKLVNEWAVDVTEHQKEDKKEFVASLKSDISAMVTELVKIGVDADINLEDLQKIEGSPVEALA